MTKSTNDSSKPAKYVEIATALREARDSLNVSLRHVAIDTRIDIQKLEHFEAGRFDLADTYTVGQLASYAKYLGLNHVVLLKLDSNKKNEKINLNKRYTRVRSYVASNSIATSVLFGVVLLAFGSAVWLTVTFFAAPKLVVYTPAEDGTHTAYSILVEGETSSGSEVFINGEPVPVDLEGGFMHRVLLSEGLNEIQIRAVNSLSREAIENRILIVDFPTVVETDDQ